jgi:hypothetical protein
MDRGLSKTLMDNQLKGILHKLGVSASDPVLDAVCGKYRCATGQTREPVKDVLARHGSGSLNGGSNSYLVEYNRFIKDLARVFPSA